MESLQVELKEKQKIDDVISRILEIPEDAVDKEAMVEWESLKSKLRVQETMEEECEDAKKRLWDIIDSLKSQQVSLMQQNLLLDAALNISILSNSVAKDELQKTEKVNEKVQQLMEKAKDTLVAQMNVMNYPDFLIQTCSYHTRRNLGRKIENLNDIVASHSNTMESLLVSEFPTYREGYKKRLRRVQRGRLRNQALFEACKEGDAEAVYILLKNNADPNKCDEHGLTPLQWSAKKGHISVAEVLIQYGRILNVDNPVAGCLVSTPLHLAALEGNVQMAELFLDLGADINAKTRDASTPLHLAVNEGKETMVKLLLSRGADVKKKNHIGNTPLDLAKAKKYDSIRKLLLKQK